MEEKQCREKLLSTEKEKLVKQINKFDGLWDLNDIPIKLKKFQTEKDEKLAFKVQLHFCNGSVCYDQDICGES